MSRFGLADIEAIEGDESDELEQAISIQRAINSGMWSLQGSYGRTMMAAIEAGRCMLGEQPARDYWGNFIPSRSMVKAGTKGSPEFVLAECGQGWLDAITAA